MHPVSNKHGDYVACGDLCPASYRLYLADLVGSKHPQALSFAKVAKYCGTTAVWTLSPAGGGYIALGQRRTR